MVMHNGISNTIAYQGLGIAGAAHNDAPARSH